MVAAPIGGVARAGAFAGLMLWSIALGSGCGPVDESEAMSPTLLVEPVLVLASDRRWPSTTFGAPRRTNDVGAGLSTPDGHVWFLRGSCLGRASNDEDVADLVAIGGAFFGSALELDGEAVLVLRDDDVVRVSLDDADTSR